MTKLIKRAYRRSLPGTGPDGNILIQDGKIAAIGQNLKADADELLDAAGCTLLRALSISMLHLRDPGRPTRKISSPGPPRPLRGVYRGMLYAQHHPRNRFPRMGDLYRRKGKAGLRQSLSHRRHYPLPQGGHLTDFAALHAAER